MTEKAAFLDAVGQRKIKNVNTAQQPVPPTGNIVAADYTYHMVFTAGRITHMAKMWNDTISVHQRDWAYRV